MARGSLNNPFKKQDESPMKAYGSQIGSTAGMILGNIIAPGVGGTIGSTLGGMIGGAIDNGGNGGSGGGSLDPKAIEADLQLQRRMAQYEQSKFSAVNPYEDMTVNLQAAEFQRQQQAQEQADVLAALRGGAGGGAGAAALATSLMRSSVAKQQQLAGEIGKQEQAIQLSRAQAQAKIDEQRRAFEQQKLETLLGIDMAKVTGMEQARLAAQQGRMNRNSQLLGAGLGFLGDIAPDVIDALSTAPNTTNSTNEQGVDYNIEDNPITAGVPPKKY